MKGLSAELKSAIAITRKPVWCSILNMRVYQCRLTTCSHFDECHVSIEPIPERLTSAKPLSEDEITIVDWLKFNSGSTLDDISHYLKLDKKYTAELLKSLIAKRWAYSTNRRYFVDDRTYL